VWLLLAWTAPSRAAAIEYFRKCCSLDPDNYLAKEGLKWSHAAWEDLRKSQKSPDPKPKPINLEPIPVTAYREQIVSISSRTETGITTWILRLGEIPFKWVLGIYLIALAIAESVTTFYHPQVGLVIHGMLLVILFLHASLVKVKVQQRFLYTLAIAPLIRLLSLSMPLAGFTITYWYAIIGLPLLLSASLVFRMTGYKPAEIGITTTKLPLQLIIGLTGIGLGWVEYQILKPTPLVQNATWGEILLPILILLIFTGFLEEFIFRGLMQRAAQDVMGKYGIYYISLLFAVLHIGYRSAIDFVFVLLVGLAFALLAKYTRSIWGITIAHGLTNIALYLIVPFL
jgi:membrane protease YdiL (CAAX protease family)